MPRSIQHFKHRTIHLTHITPELLNNAVRALERLAGVAAFANHAQQSIAVEYWLDEYDYAELVIHLGNCGFTLVEDEQHHQIRLQIQGEEEREREGLCTRHECRSAGVFAKTYSTQRDDFEQNAFNL